MEYISTLADNAYDKDQHSSKRENCSTKNSFQKNTIHDSYEEYLFITPKEYFANIGWLVYEFYLSIMENILPGSIRTVCSVSFQSMTVPANCNKYWGLYNEVAQIVISRSITIVIGVATLQKITNRGIL